MNSTILPKPPPPIYPCLKTDRRNNLVVLFTSKNTGTVVHVGGSPQLLGTRLTYWEEKEFFKPFNGEVKISN